MKDSEILKYIKDAIAGHATTSHGDTYGVMDIKQFPSGGATEESYYWRLNGANEQLNGSLRIPADCDVSKDITITFTYRSIVLDATIAFLKYMGTRAVDMTEDISNNIFNAVGFNLDGDPINKIGTWTLTLVGGNAAIDDWVHYALKMNEAGRDVWFFSCFVLYQK